MKFKLLILFVALYFLSGLGNLRELNDLAVVSSIGINKTEDGKYITTVQITNSSKQTAKGDSLGSGGEVVVYESTDVSIQQALRNMILESPKKLYLAHMELLIVSENIAREDLNSAIDFFIRDHEASNSFMLLVARNTTPENILKTLTPLETNPTVNIKDSIETTYKYKSSTTPNVLMQTLSDLLNSGKDFAIASVTLDNTKSNKLDNKEETKEDNKEESKKDPVIIVSDMAYFKNEQMKGYLSVPDNISYNILQNTASHYVAQVDTSEENKFIVDAIKTDVKLSPKVENGKYIVNIDVSAVTNISEIGKNVKLQTVSDIENYQKKVAEHIKNRLTDFVKNCNNVYNSDLIGYGDLFRKKQNKEFLKVKDKFYTDIFPNIETNINVKVRFQNEGGITKKW